MRDRDSLFNLLAILSLAAMGLYSAAAEIPSRPPAVQNNARSAEAVMAEVQRLVAAAGDAHSREALDLDRRIHLLGEAVHRLDAGAIEPLGRYLNDESRPLRARLYAAAFLGLQGDRRAFRPLKACLIDPSNDPSLRAAALNSIQALPLPVPTLRAMLEFIIAAAPPHEYPDAVSHEAMSSLAVLGARDLSVASDAARRYGSDPEFEDAAKAYYMIRALAVSPDPRAAAALLDLLGFYRRGSSLERAALHGVEERGRDLGRLGPERLARLVGVLKKRWGQNPVLAAQILGELRDLAAVPALLDTLQAPDPAVVAETAGALALIGDPAAAAPLRRLAESLTFDPRFAQKEGGPDVGPLAARVRRSADSFPYAPGETAEAKPTPLKTAVSTGTWNPWQVEEWDSGALFGR